MERRKKIAVAGLVLGLGILACMGVPSLYRAMDAGYQRNMDPIRIQHAHAIVALILTYADETGQFPFAGEATQRPFMVLIGHSQEEEDAFMSEPVLSRGAKVANSSVLEAELSKGLGRPVRLPRDPQRVPTYAPNVYVYFLAGDQMTVAVHLFNEAEGTIPYDWQGGRFYSYSKTYLAKNEAPSSRPVPPGPTPAP